MAKTHFVTSYRGQRKCQWTGGCEICNYPETDRLHLRDAQYRFVEEEGHRFQGLPKCELPRKEHNEDTHPFTQTPKRCERCGKSIEIGDPYKWVAPRAHRAARGTRRTRCTNCPGWKPSELTSSQHLAQIYAAQEDADEALAVLEDPETPEDAEAFLEDLRGIAEQAAETIRGASETYQESADNIEEGFGHPTYQSEELADNAQMVGDWADELEYLDFEDFEAEEPVCVECGLPESASEHDADNETDEAHDYDEDTIEDDLGQWADEQRGLIYDAMAESPV